MIERDLAEKTKAVVLDCVRKLDASVKTALDGAPELHASMYRRLVGKIMGHLYTEVLAPIYFAYPDLEPEELKKARLDSSPVLMPPEVGVKLRDTGTSVSTALDGLREELAQEGNGEAGLLKSALQGSLELVQNVQEFLRRVSPGMDEKQNRPSLPDRCRE